MGRIARSISPYAPSDPPAPAPAASPIDSPEVRRLRRTLLDQDDRLEIQAALIRDTRAELSAVYALLANPGLSAADKVTIIAVAKAAHEGDGRTYLEEQLRTAEPLGPTEVPYSVVHTAGADPAATLMAVVEKVVAQASGGRVRAPAAPPDAPNLLL